MRMFFNFIFNLAIGIQNKVKRLPYRKIFRVTSVARFEVIPAFNFADAFRNG